MPDDWSYETRLLHIERLYGLTGVRTVKSWAGARVEDGLTRKHRQLRLDL